MLGYIYALLQTTAATARGYCSKKISIYVENAAESAILNCVRMLCCVAIGLIYGFATVGSPLFSPTLPQLLICLISGAAMGLLLITWTLALKSGAYMLVNTASCVAFVIPCVFGLTLFGEKFTLFKGISFALIIAAIFFMLRYNFSFKGKLTPKSIVLLLCVFLGQGINQSGSKFFTYYFNGTPVGVYTFYTFVATAVVLLVFALFTFKNTSKPKEKVKKSFWYLFTMAVSIFLATFFEVLASKQIDAIILYPLLNALSLIAGSLMASISFGEKIKKDSVIGIISVFAALVLSNM